MCGMKSRELSVYISRLKVVMSGDYFDDSIETNKLFLAKFRGNNREDKAEKPAIQVEEKKVKVLEIREPEPAEIDVPDVGQPVNLKYLDLEALEKEKKKVDIQKGREQIEILKVQKQKLHGTLIPTELVVQLMILHTESIKVAYSEALDNMIIRIGHKKKLTSAEEADIKKQVGPLLNKAIDNAIRASKKGINNIVDEYSEKKGRGEREYSNLKN
jgi:hypothetical protein